VHAHKYGGATIPGPRQGCGGGFDTGFDKIELAAGKAPDMSHLDAGVCPFMEKAVNEKGAETEQEIRAAVKKA